MKKIGDILSTDAAFVKIKRDGERIRRMNAFILQALTASGIDSTGCEIAEFSEGVLHLQSESAAVIFRIRQILPTLRDSLKKSGFPVATIRVSVATHARHAPTPPAREK